MVPACGTEFQISWHAGDFADLTSVVATRSRWPEAIIGRLCMGMESAPLAEPTGDAHAGFIGGQDFVPEIAGHEADEGAHPWLDEFEGSGFLAGTGPEFQFPAVSGLPVFIEI